MKLNPNVKVVEVIQKRLIITGGYCLVFHKTNGVKIPFVSVKK